MNTAPQPAPSKPDPVTIILKLILLMMAAVPAAICYLFFFGKLFGTILFLAYGFIMPLLIWLLRRHRKMTEAEMLRRIDKAMGKPSDDPRQMANFM